VDEDPREMPATDELPAMTGDGAALMSSPDDPTVERLGDPVPGQPTELPTAADAVAIGRLVDEILPLLIARFRAGRMGELEVRRAGWHVRVRRPADELSPMTVDSAAIRGPDGRRSRTASAGQTTGHGHPPTGQTGAGTGLAAVGPGRPSDGHGAAPAAGASLVAASPGVGYYATRDGIATGSQVRSGDVLGHVDVLGVRQEVIAPGDGIVARLLAEAGEAVEYGQDLVRLEPVSRTDSVREA
jgi:biotin carboxyl carrier protein